MFCAGYANTRLMLLPQLRSYGATFFSVII